MLINKSEVKKYIKSHDLRKRQIDGNFYDLLNRKVAFILDGCLHREGGHHRIELI